MRVPRLSYSPIGAAGAYPAWVRALDGASGGYVIAEAEPGARRATVVYVGESHTGNLYATLTRHFQAWRRSKAWWVGQYSRGGGETPGYTYDRARCQVAVVLTAADDAIAMQWALIEKLCPRDNQIGRGNCEPAPF